MKSFDLETVVLVFIASAFTAFALGILVAISEDVHAIRVIHETTWQPPAIPMCDAPVWDRITEGCEHEGD